MTTDDLYQFATSECDRAQKAYDKASNALRNTELTPEQWDAASRRVRYASAVLTTASRDMRLLAAMITRASRKVQKT